MRKESKPSATVLMRNPLAIGQIHDKRHVTTTSWPMNLFTQECRPVNLSLRKEVIIGPGGLGVLTTRRPPFAYVSSLLEQYHCYFYNRINHLIES